MKIFPMTVDGIEYHHPRRSLSFTIREDSFCLSFPYAAEVKHNWDLNKYPPELLVATIANRFFRSPWFRLIAEVEGPIRRQYLLLAVRALVNRVEVDGNTVDVSEGTIDLALSGRTSGVEFAGRVWSSLSTQYGLLYTLKGTIEDLLGQYEVIVKSSRPGETVVVDSRRSLTRAMRQFGTGSILLLVETPTSRYLLTWITF